MTYVHGNFKGGAREGWVRQENWINGPPADVGWIQRSWSKDDTPDNWEDWENSWDSRDDVDGFDRKLDSYIQRSWSKDDTPDNWEDWENSWDSRDDVDGFDRKLDSYIQRSWSKDDTPDNWEDWENSWDSRDDVDGFDRKLDSYSYYWTQTGTKRYVHGNFKGGAREGWVRQENWINGPPADVGWIQRSWSKDDTPDNWEDWENSWDSRDDVDGFDRKLDSYSYYWTQTGTKRYIHGNFK